ncbi:MAG TPA: DNA mismatch repair endonuclease MutL [Clostridiales bacterium]|nr:DNA mismatch repair endonuclease MutL [Clostridiales bacterium]
MPVIRKLDNYTINQIAAGEVVERPASIVKELMENSIDADATAITVEIENGGISLIRVTDNGIGMEQDDAEISFQRHATSKIASAADLNQIHTLGFRGEALASIAAVTQVEMITRKRDSVSGCHIVNHGGKILSINETGCPEGTTILVRNLFFNTPARLKFLRSPRSETAAISEMLAKLILANPHISIKYISNGKTVYHSPGNGNLLNAIFSVYGREVNNELISIDAKPENDIAISGFIGKPSMSRTNRSHQTFFVNGRYIKSNLLSQSVEEALKDHTMINHFPWCVFNIRLPANEVDVNVHPSKTEVRFRDPNRIYNLLMVSVREAAENKPYIPSAFSVNAKSENESKQGETAEFSRENKPVRDSRPIFQPEQTEPVNNISSGIQSSIFIKEDYPSPLEQGESSKSVHIKRDIQDNLFPDSGMNDEKDDNTIIAYDFMKMNIIGTAFSTYILVESDNRLYFIDQHAAHERLIYEKLKESVKNHQVLSQQLLPPYVIEVTHDEFIIMSDNIDSFKAVGFDMEPFGGKSFIIRGIPVLIKENDIRQMFRELLDLRNSISGQERLVLQEEDIIKMSCKKAVKAHDKLSQQEVRSLLQDLGQRKVPLTCPHGRPILVSLSKYELEKKFKRIQ